MTHGSVDNNRHCSGSDPFSVAFVPTCNYNFNMDKRRF